MKLALCTLTAIGLAGFALAAGGCKESGIDARKTADALSEEFTDGIEFEDSTLVDGPPPDSNADEPTIWWIDAPKAVAPTDLAIPESTDYDQQFVIRLDTSQVLDDGSALGIIAHVKQANKDDQAERYYRIEPQAADFAGQSVTLRATVVSNNRLGGNAFHVRLAMLMANGDVGPYKEWNIVTYPAPGATPKIEMCQCTFETQTEPAVTGAPDATYERMVRTNLRLSPQCTGDAEKSLREEIDGWPGDGTQPATNADPCYLFHSCYGIEAPMEEFLIPSGTRFNPYWVEMQFGVDPETCWVQLDCD